MNDSRAYPTWDYLLPRFFQEIFFPKKSIVSQFSGVSIHTTTRLCFPEYGLSAGLQCLRYKLSPSSLEIWQEDSCTCAHTHSFSVLPVSFLKNHPVPFSLCFSPYEYQSCLSFSQPWDPSLLYWSRHTPPSAKPSELEAPFLYDIPSTVPATRHCQLGNCGSPMLVPTITAPRLAVWSRVPAQSPWLVNARRNDCFSSPPSFSQFQLVRF